MIGQRLIDTGERERDREGREGERNHTSLMNVQFISSSVQLEIHPYTSVTSLIISASPPPARRAHMRFVVEF